MTDVRSLLAKEREARRIQHPHLSYSKSGALTCTVCSLNVKSEALWEGHLKSGNHRKNLREATSNSNGAGNGKKRKIEEFQAEEENSRKRKTDDIEVDTRKKREVSFTTSAPEQIPPLAITATAQEAEAPLSGFVRSEATALPPTPSPPPIAAPDPPPVPSVDEDEWAAFEAEVAPLARDQDFTSATISAAPISASELAAQQAAEARRSRSDFEVEDEKEEEEQRMADEFDVMEEMEERVRRLKEKREALRLISTDQIVREEETVEAAQPDRTKPPEDDEDDSDDEVDDWYL